MLVLLRRVWHIIVAVSGVKMLPFKKSTQDTITYDTLPKYEVEVFCHQRIWAEFSFFYDKEENILANE